MRLSILIPVYNQNIMALVAELVKQCRSVLGDAFELVVIDDASPNEMGNPLGLYEKIKYDKLDVNAGRSAIRNLLAQRASGEFLLFIDCDASVIKEDFIEKYLSHAKSGSVVCGGTAYQETPPSSLYTLHWTYGAKREALSLAERIKQPFKSFKTFHFLVSKTDFEKSGGFEEGIKSYGHEDTLYGYALEKAGIDILHIENPMRHDGLELNSVFIQKTKSATIGLAKMQHTYPLLGKAKVARFCFVLKKICLLSLMAKAIGIFESKLISQINSRIPNLRYLDLLKVKWFAEGISKRDKNS